MCCTPRCRWPDEARRALRQVRAHGGAHVRATEAVVMETVTWHGAYDHGWKVEELTAESFSHPAKMARGLVYRIVSEGLRLGFWDRSRVSCPRR